MTKTLFATLGILLLLALAPLSVGCAGAGDAAAASDDSESTDAQQAKNTEEGEGEKDGDDEEGEDEEKKEAAVPVEVVALEIGAIESVLSFSANLEAENEVVVMSQAKRLITDLLVEEGDRVQRGQVLLRLEDDEQRSALAKVKSQLAKAEREYQRQSRLYHEQLISEEDYNNATYDLEQLRISLDDAERELGYTVVQAPISGTITSRKVNLGDQVQIGQELFEIVDFDSIVARIYVPEKHITELSPGLSARISSQAAGGDEHSCTVKRIAPIVDPKSGTVKVTIDVGRRAGLRPGMYVDVDLVAATHDEAVLLPKRALVYDNDQIFVYKLAEDSRVERIFVEPRLTDKHFVEPAEGLQAGDRVVIAGQAGLKDGALVKLPGEEQEASADDDDATVQRASL